MPSTRVAATTCSEIGKPWGRDGKPLNSSIVLGRKVEESETGTPNALEREVSGYIYPKIDCGDTSGAEDAFEDLCSCAKRPSRLSKWPTVLCHVGSWFRSPLAGPKKPARRSLQLLIQNIVYGSRV